MTDRTPTPSASPTPRDPYARLSLSALLNRRETEPSLEHLFGAGLGSPSVPDLAHRITAIFEAAERHVGELKARVKAAHARGEPPIGQVYPPFIHRGAHALMTAALLELAATTATREFEGRLKAWVRSRLEGAPCVIPILLVMFDSALAIQQSVPWRPHEADGEAFDLALEEDERLYRLARALESYGYDGPDRMDYGPDEDGGPRRPAPVPPPPNSPPAATPPEPAPPEPAPAPRRVRRPPVYL